MQVAEDTGLGFKLLLDTIASYQQLPTNELVPTNNA